MMGRRIKDATRRRRQARSGGCRRRTASAAAEQAFALPILFLLLVTTTRTILLFPREGQQRRRMPSGFHPTGIFFAEAFCPASIPVRTFLPSLSSSSRSCSALGRGSTRNGSDGSAHDVVATATTPTCSSRRGGRRRGSSPSLVIRRMATVYAPWEEQGSSLEGGEEGEGAEAPTEGPSWDRLGEAISRESAAVLARLAVAFSPPSRSLRLQDIENVQVLRIDPTKGIMDLQAVVCEDDGCVTLRVPIAFPEPCPVVVDDGGSFEDEETEPISGNSVAGEVGCVRANLDRLDAQAMQVIRTLEWGDHHYEEEAARERTRRRLLLGEDHQNQPQHQPPCYPEWWIAPHQQGASMFAPSGSSTLHALAGECESVRRLLNDPEFGSALRAMASQALLSAEKHDYQDWEVEQAAVVAVGPRGLVLRAAVRRQPPLLGGEQPPLRDHQGLPQHQLSHGTTVVEIPVPFPTAGPSLSSLDVHSTLASEGMMMSTAATAEELQTLVLALVASAESFVE